MIMKSTNLDKGRYIKVALALFRFLFVGMTVQAQTNVYMHPGTQNVPANGYVNFYDSGGPSSTDGSYNWEKWYSHNENATIVFKNGDAPIQVEFSQFIAWDNDGDDYFDIGQYSLRINNDHLYVYDGEEDDADKLIADLTGTIVAPFTITTNGPITFKFVSDGNYRDEGWAAKVTSPLSYTMQSPIIAKEECSDYVMLYNTVLGGQMYYSTDGNDADPFDPLSEATPYDNPFSIDLDDEDASVLVRTIVVKDETASVTGSYTFHHSDQRPVPDEPTIKIEGNTVTITPPSVPHTIKETYNIRYTTDGTTPSATHGTLLTKSTTGFSFEWHTPNTTFKAVTVAVNCPNSVSAVVSKTFGNVTVPTPTIVFDNEGKATISCSLQGATIYYTTDGSVPTTTSAHGTTTVTTEALAIGTTVYAYATYGSTGYEDSELGSAVYVPAGGSDVYDNVVLLDDREPHSWSYYSDGDQPVHSLNPADVKITYFGYGNNTMTTTDISDNPTTFNGNVASTAVAVGPGAPGNQFIYLKTLEATNEDGSGNYPYTLIPNPFSVRPKYEGGGGGSTPETYTVYLSYSVSNNRIVTYSYYNASGTLVESGDITSGNSATITVKANTTITLTARRRNNGNTAATITAYYDDANGQQIVQASTTSQTAVTESAVVDGTGSGSSSSANYRGFYAWRVKRLSGVTIEGYGVNSIIPAETEIKFVAAANSTNNEVEFEALWAQAYVVTSNTATGLHAGVSYERNFIVGTTAASVGVPVTYSGYYPDGTSAGTASVNGFTCEADTKFEYMTISGGTFTAANHDLIMGRGLIGTASRLRGIGGAATDLDYTIRVESGTYTNFSFVNEQGSGNVSGRYLVKSIMGCDYDRANKDNSKLSVSPNAQLFYSTNVTFGGSGNKDQKTFDCVFKSGSYQSGYWGNNVTNNGDYQHSTYLGQNSAGNTYPGMRFVVVEGGEFGSMNGGRGVGSESETYASPGVVTFDLRIKGGLFHGCVYGAAADNPSIGSRRIVVTGGEIRSWLAGGCNGTGSTSNSGATNGNSFIYVGGNAVIGGSNASEINGTAGGQVFGAGRGLAGRAGSMLVSNVVVADHANISNNVYGGGYNSYIVNTSNVYILGGTIQRNVFGGSYGNGTAIPTTNVFVKGGTITGSAYGGSNSTGTVANSHVTMSGGETTNVFGGGLGASTIIGANTQVTVSGGTVNNNVYGGGEEGSVTGSTSVAVSGGTMNDVYGAGKGVASATGASANIGGSTTVAISGGAIAGSVYGGGENGTVAYAQSGANNANYKSTVNMSNGEVKGDVYGGGKMGTSQVATTVNLSGGIVRGNVFGGAYGEQQKVFVTGLRTVNMTGGHVYGNVYGGSRNANDGNNTTLANNTFSSSTATEQMCVTNISGGIIDENVYAAGYFGNTFGSVYIFLGKDAIEKAPYHLTQSDITFGVKTLSITGSVWAGGDWGTFNGEFGGNTVSGNSNIYVDGTNYETTTHQATNAQYFNIGGSVLGCGTSCHAGKQERTIIVRNYGHAEGNQPAEATRALYSIQFAKVLIFDNANLNFTGQGRVNNMNQTEKYAIYEIGNGVVTDSNPEGVRVVNGSGLFLNSPVAEIANFRSMSCADVYASTTPTLTGYSVIMPDDLATCNNQVRVNGGNYIEVKYDSQFGPVIGYTHMMVSNAAADATCAYARPRWETKAQFEMNDENYDNRNDGGWVSYDSEKNTYALDGSNGDDINDDPVQMAYENHTVRNGENYFRIWRDGGNDHYREGIFDAHATGTDVWKTVDVTITLPAFRDPANYYCFETNGDATTIDYGADVLMWNAARKTGTGDDWMYYKETDPAQQMSGQSQSAVETTLTEMKKGADVNFGLVILPSTGLSGGDYIICYESDNNLASADTKFSKSDNTKEPQVVFRLTYYDKLSSNMTWDPSTIVLVQKDASGNVVDRVKVSLAVATSSTIEQVFTTQLYAIMQGKGSTSDTYTAKVVLPTFSSNLYTAGVAAKFKLNSVTYEPVAGTGGNLIPRGGTDDQFYNLNNYAVGYAASFNYDNTDGWNGAGDYTESDAYPMTLTDPSPTADPIGETGGRQEFAIDFTLHYDGSKTVSTEEKIGELTFHFTFDNYKDANGNLVTNQPLTIVVEVWRRGQGTRFYLDGIHGSNANDAKHPDQAAKQLSTIFNRCGYMAGDEIYIVNLVTADKQLDWNGLKYDNVVIYRYNGGHELSSSTASIIDNENNESYKGTLVNVTNYMTMTGITLDGYYNDGKTSYQIINPTSGAVETHTTDPNGGPHTVTATASLVTVAQDGILELSMGSMLTNNNSSSVNGAAVNVAEGGKLMMNQDAQIKDNLTTGNGGGVYMAGTMVVSDDVQIIDNYKGEVQNNVYLTAADKVITLGTAAANDAYGALSSKAKIGVTKTLTADIDGAYTRVVNVDEDVEWLETPYVRPNSVIYHDGGKYQLEKYSDPKYLYWVGTWVTLQDHKPTTEEGGWIYPDDISEVTNFDIKTQYQFAWIISLVNGENGCTANNFAGKTVNILADLDMYESIWVPIGTQTTPFKGTLKGNGHLIENMRSSLVLDYMGMFGNTEGATIQDVMALVSFEANSANMGSVAGVVKTTNISNVEGAGSIQGGNNTVNLGGLVGKVESGTIHSSFAVNDLTGATATVMGGLIGTNGGNLYNSFANATLTGSTKMGGLVGANLAGCKVENCYVNLGTQDFPAFANTNLGTITYCYASKAGNYVGSDASNVAPVKSGNFAAVKDRKALGYLYNDNLVTAPAENTYANHQDITYIDKHTVVWNGLLSVLNQYVADNSIYGYSTWNRPLTTTLNGDLPILAFPKDNCLGNYADEDGKVLRYSAYNLNPDTEAGETFSNGLDALFANYSGKAANIFLYGNATDVVNGSGNANLFIHEDAVLLQKEGTKAMETINATVGVTFDNSSKSATDYFGGDLTYDWHLMSTPLADAAFGVSYTSGAETGYGKPADWSKVENSYFPNMTNGSKADDAVTWDFYTYFEPQYHWINFKRSAENHWHYDEPHDQINYTGTEQTSGKLTAGRGYMMAISQDSYMSNTGALNNGEVPMPLTVSGTLPETELPSKDWGSNLVGNPYQAYLDLNLVASTNGLSTTGFYVYDADNGVYGPYMAGASVNTAIPSQFIHPHQAFFVVTEEAKPNFKFTYDMATASNNTASYYRGEVQPMYPLVNLFVENEQGNRDLTIVEFNRTELGGVRKVNNLRNANFKLSAYLEGTNYGLVFTPEGTERVPVHFRTMEDGTFTLTWQTMHGTFTNLILVDNLTGTRTNMLTTDHYTFEGSVDDYAARFYITFNVTGVDELNGEDGGFAWFDGNDWIVTGKGQLDVIDVTGRVLRTERVSGEQTRLHLDGVAAGVYMMRLSEGNRAMTQKIVVK
jgi:hypothetical protein